MSNRTIEFQQSDNYCSIILNREDKCHAINEELIEELDVILSEIESDKHIRLVEVTAKGDKFFCAGGDINSWSAYSPLDMGRKWIKRGNEVFNRLRNLPKLTVANINGHAIGGGLELALCCDIRIARPNAKFSTPEVTLGMIPGWMGIERILSIVPQATAREMLLLGKRLTAGDAAKAGLINLVVEKDDMPAWRAARMEEVGKCGPVALAHIKQLVNSITDKHTSFDHQLLAALMSATADCQSATDAFVRKQSQPPLFSDN
ncbi:enoyl-CoA hydratase/isomerase family protein [Sodalis ligni]|uniref:Enoyl-CoA hydratase/carnithine racemase n=1 Tax=Sodalis ligni TaxID=2697027 RepID=A0A4R1N4K5_9GAMM|nr:enoyl-CoA hydratase/isomerase family protein [Sodalis ligni]TCL02095.1 enoyl-CoA hydratase/carnithine racemase [Sodalis ligni]